MTHFLQIAALVVCWASAAIADGGFFADSEVVFLGEYHDNPYHHARQAELVARIAPRALVFEMLTQDQAARITPDLLANPAALEAALAWADSGWPDFSMYYPIFVAAHARVYGAALPREAARRVMEEGGITVFGAGASAYGLDAALGPDQQARREALQSEAHCDQLPESMLPGMVEIQRLRDAQLARAAAQALDDTGGPVVVITGNGHARRDWGAPALLEQARPGLKIAVLGQGEITLGAPVGVFDLVELSPKVDRGDPCAAFADAPVSGDGDAAPGD